MANDTLLACPFCGGAAEVERAGTSRQSCIVRCEDCGAKVESNEQGAGRYWNMRTTAAPSATHRAPLPNKPQWRSAPTAAEVSAHAAAHGSGNAPWTPGGADWLKAPKIPTGLWMIRKQADLNGSDLRAARGWFDGEQQPQIFPLGAHEGRVWFGVRQLTNDLMETRWMQHSECRPVNMDGQSVAWPMSMAEELGHLLDEAGLVAVFGLKKQGHLETIERLLADGSSWEAIGAAIGWDGATAKQHWGWHLERQRIEPGHVTEPGGTDAD